MEQRRVSRSAEANPRCSVILCTYNRRNLVLSTLASLRRQTLSYEQFEVIVVDNGSTDGTIAAVRSYVNAGSPIEDKRAQDIWRVKCLVEPRNGLAYARNTGIQAATGEIAVFLDDDTLADPRFLERLLMAYDGTGADAIGGRVELRWEASRPHWLSNDLLDMLGHFAPAQVRTQLPMNIDVSSCNFSVKMEVLRSVHCFSTLLGKRATRPTSMEVADLCRRLRAVGYTIWYEPEAVVLHRISAARLTRPYFVGRAYWQGRSEALAQYADTQQHHVVLPQTLSGILHTTLAQLKDVAHIALVDRPLLFFAGKPTDERLLAAMAQARNWGHIQQRLQFIEHAPVQTTAPAVFFVRPTEKDVSANLLLRALQTQHVRCMTGTLDIPLSWLWRHRAYQGETIGILHFYRPGAYMLTPGQRQRLLFLIWLAQYWGIRIVITDTGGWWQSTRGLHALPHRAFESSLLRRSDAILSFTRQPDQLYPDKRLRRRALSFAHPGFRGYYSPVTPREEAYKRIGLSPRTQYVYLCFAAHHSERELMHLIDVFTTMRNNQQGQQGQQKQRIEAHLLLVGSPHDSKTTLLQRAALNPAVSLFLEDIEERAIPLYMGAADAVVLPHFAQHTAGMLETAMLALSFERKVVVPNLPRFRGMLPPRASVLYDPASRESLAQALRTVQDGEFHLKHKEKKALDAESSWKHYAQRLTEVYKQVLGLS